LKPPSLNVRFATFACKRDALMGKNIETIDGADGTNTVSRVVATGFAAILVRLSEYWARFCRRGCISKSRSVADGIGSRKGFACSVFIWSLAWTAYGLANWVNSFKIVRFAVGTGKSGNIYTNMKTVTVWLSEEEKAMATGALGLICLAFCLRFYRKPKIKEMSWAATPKDFMMLESA
jgi:hypothetical protein